MFLQSDFNVTIDCDLFLKNETQPQIILLYPFTAFVSKKTPTKHKNVSSSQNKYTIAPPPVKPIQGSFQLVFS